MKMFKMQCGLVVDISYILFVNFNSICKVIFVFSLLRIDSGIFTIVVGLPSFLLLSYDAYMWLDSGS